MGTDAETSQDRPHLNTGPIDIGNELYLDLRLRDLKERFSEKRLSGLSQRRLRGEVNNSKGSEEEALYNSFNRLYRQFPDRDYTGGKALQRVQKEDNYRCLSPLTIEQRDQIEEAKIECIRNLDRAMQEATNRERSPSIFSRFGSWLNAFVSNLTPVVKINL